MSRVLTVDQGVFTGWAVRTHEKRIMFGTESFKEWEGFSGRVHYYFEKWFNSFLGAVKPTHILSEAPIFRGAQSEYLYGFSVIMTKLAFERGIITERVNLMTVKKQIANRGGADKERMIRCVRELGYDVATEHEADATAILLFRERRCPEEIPTFTGKTVSIKPRVLNRIRRRKGA